MRCLLLWLFLALGGCISAPGAEASPLPQAHSHNDYLQPRPLQAALEAGFCSVEADLWWIDGKLLVAHDREKVQAQRTLERLYLDPLRARVRANGGSVFPTRAPFTLLIDIKSEANPTYESLRTTLSHYRDVLTEYDEGVVRTNAITVILSGNRPFALLAKENLRWAALDGRLPDLTNHLYEATVMPMISDNWSKTFHWNGTGTITQTDLTRLHDLVRTTHAQGRTLRFWAAPDRPEAWAILREAQVDYINTDKLSGLSQFLRTTSPP